MKDLDHLVPEGHHFTIDDENPFFITPSDLQHLVRVGELTSALFRATLQGLSAEPASIASKVLFGGNVVFGGLDDYYRHLGKMNPERCPVLTRVDMMIDVHGNWRIAEIDPSNKHGLGFALATRFESGAGERQKLLSLLAKRVTSSLVIVLGQRETFFRHELRFLAEKLAEHTGKEVRVVSEDKLAKKLRPQDLILDFPFCYNPVARELLIKRFQSRPGSFINPPSHALGSKAIMSLPWEYTDWLLDHGMNPGDLEGLQEYIPPTYCGPFVVKETFCSGAKGVFFDQVHSLANTVSQKYVPQLKFELGGQQQFVRVACFYVGGKLAELIVSADDHLPVHGGKTAVHYHVNVTK